MTSRTSHESTADEQGASSENDAPCGGARRRRPSDRLLKRFRLTRVDALVDIDVLSDAQRDESPEDTARVPKRRRERLRTASARRQCAQNRWPKGTRITTFARRTPKKQRPRSRRSLTPPSMTRRFFPRSLTSWRMIFCEKLWSRHQRFEVVSGSWPRLQSAY